jgi:hypothetical protein
MQTDTPPDLPPDVQAHPDPKPAIRKLQLDKIGKDGLDTLTKSLTMFVTLAYALGFVIVNAHTASFGFTHAPLVSGEYVVAGIPMSLILLISLLAVVRFESAAPTKPKGRWRRYAILLLPTITLILSALFIGSIGTSRWNIIKVVVGVVIIHAMSSLVFYQYYHLYTDDVDIGVYLPAFLGISVLMIAFILISGVAYGRGVYPHLSPIIGGGEPEVVDFITDSQNREAVSQLIPMDTEQRTIRVQLIRETNNGFFVYADVLTDSASIYIDRDLIKGIIYYEP